MATAASPAAPGHNHLERRTACLLPRMSRGTYRKQAQRIENRFVCQPESVSGYSSEPMAPARVRIRDVAKAAGTAPSTVSNALNGKGHVDPATRERITQVAAELGYVPNRTARGLRSGRAGVLGIMLSGRPEAGEVANVSYNLRLAGS